MDVVLQTDFLIERQRFPEDGDDMDSLMFTSSPRFGRACPIESWVSFSISSFNPRSSSALSVSSLCKCSVSRSCWQEDSKVLKGEYSSGCSCLRTRVFTLPDSGACFVNFEPQQVSPYSSLLLPAESHSTRWFVSRVIQLTWQRETVIRLCNHLVLCGQN